MNFSYKAYFGNGVEERGTIEAPDKDRAIAQLAQNGRIAFELIGHSDVVGAAKKARRESILIRLRGMGRLSQSRLFLELAILTEAGMTLPQALRALRSSESVHAQRLAFEAVASNMAAGMSAADSFSKIRDISAETIALIASAERAAKMPSVLRAIAEQMANKDRQFSEFKDALAYPAFLLIVMALAVGVVTFVLVPALAPIFDNANQTPPMTIQVLMTVREAGSNPLIIWLGVGFLIATLSLMFSEVRRRLNPVFQRTVWSLPLVGAAVRKSSCARYLGSLSLLLSGGTPMTEALDLAASCNPFLPLRSRLKSVKNCVSAGERLPAALEQTQQFDAKIIALLAIGDEVNRLPVVLNRASSILDQEAKLIVDRLLAAMTPTITIFLGLVIGGLVVSVMTALLSVNDLALQ